MAEHLSHVEVERTDPVTLLKRKVGVAGGLTYHIERSTLTLGNLAHMVDMFFLNEQSHSLLALVGDDFLRREGLVADRQLGHVDRTAAFLHQLRQAVHMTGRTMVVDGNHRIHIFLTQRTDEVVGAFLHLWVGTLNGIQLNSTRITARID